MSANPLIGKPPRTERGPDEALPRDVVRPRRH
jgi:hypothetical protein